MYKISVPIMNCNVKRSDREKLLAQIKRFDAERVFLAMDTYETDPEKRQIALAELADNCAYFKQRGFEVGAWIWAFWVNDNKDFRCMRSIKGTDIHKFMCPTDDRFLRFASDYIRDIAACGVDLIQFDDDLRYGALSDSPACLCEGHIALINGLTGENSSREELKNHITNGGKNKYRDAYLKANGDAFRRFASTMRAAVDSVNPAIRMGACACMSSWDIDGVDAYELAQILAGKTKPFVRLIGAPYWATKRGRGNSLEDVIEYERAESVWTRRGDIEIFAEGDAYPRPRLNCPASFLEGFDTAIRASGCTDGILKYGLDYCSNADYETGYAVYHERNRATYRAIDDLFGNKVSCGVRVYEYMKKVGDMVMPTRVNDREDIERLFISKAARPLAANSIPTVYEGDGVCGIVFDENARHLPLSALHRGLILDIAAAEILTERGIDVGLEAIGAPTEGIEEHFLNNDNYISARHAISYHIKLKDKAETLSDMQTEQGKTPLSYRYENAQGQRFLVLNINTRFDKSDFLLHYARGKQIAENIPWLSGQQLPAYAYGHPSLYMQCKKNENAMAVGLWNFFADAATSPVIELDQAYRDIRWLGCSGRMDGNKIFLSDIPPFGFVGFEVSKH